MTQRRFFIMMQVLFTLFILDAYKMGTLANSEEPDEKQYFIRIGWNQIFMTKMYHNLEI